MVQDPKKASCCAITATSTSCCKVESLVTVDERGQMVLPKEIRDRAEIRPGDKLALVSWEKDGKVCCITLIKAGDLTAMVKDLLGPMLDELSGRPANQ
jgi:antitoxin PrlF